MKTQALRDLAEQLNLEIWRDAVFTVKCEKCGDADQPSESVVANGGRRELDDEMCAKCPTCGHWCPMPPATGRIGWFWWCCSPGCLPEGEPNGPFNTEREALENATDGLAE